VAIWPREIHWGELFQGVAALTFPEDISECWNPTSEGPKPMTAVVQGSKRNLEVTL
jgi:hypothetical protein